MAKQRERERERMEPWRELALQKHKQKLKIEKVQEREIETREYGYDMHTDTVILRNTYDTGARFPICSVGFAGPNAGTCMQHARLYIFSPLYFPFGLMKRCVRWSDPKLQAPSLRISSHLLLHSVCSFIFTVGSKLVLLLPIF